MAEAVAQATPVQGALQAAPRGQSLDEVMLAMDVVDTLRHQDTLVARELDEGRREAELLDRLRRIYRGQGIDVPDAVLQEGVKALRESRFVYTPPPAGLRTTLARLWVGRGRIGAGLLGLVLAGGVGLGAYQVGVVRPAEQRAEQARAEAERERSEIGTLLPRALETGHREVLDEAKVDKARERAEALLRDGRAALARGDRAGAQQAIADLELLRAELRREYVLRIPNGPASVVWRVPRVNRSARNYYAIVDALAPDGQPVRVRVVSEETGETAEVSRWGVRVPEEMADAIRRDKEQDGIVQRNRLGEKRRGFLDVEYLMPVLGGAILRWDR